MLHGIIMGILITGTILAIIITLWLKTPISIRTTTTTGREKFLIRFLFSFFS